MGGEDGCDGSLGIYTVFCVPDSDDVKQKNSSHALQLHADLIVYPKNLKTWFAE